MTQKEIIKRIYYYIDQDSNYGRIVRWIFALKWIKFEPFYKGQEMKEDEIEYYFIYDGLLGRLLIDMITAFKEHRTIEDLRNWSVNYYLKAKGSEITDKDTPKALVEIATSFKQDFDDVIEGRCEHWFTKEVRSQVFVGFKKYEEEA